MRTISIDEIVSVSKDGFILKDGENVRFSQCKRQGAYFCFDYRIGYAPDFDLPCYEFHYPTEADQPRVTCKNRKNEKWIAFAQSVRQYQIITGYRKFDMS